jgi:hypothetical protein|nr:MAG TPA: bifunctional protein PutA [Caudoviricetes sp.]
MSDKKEIKLDIDLLRQSKKERGNAETEAVQEQSQNKTEIISIRLDPLTKEKLAYICDLEYRPVALQIRKIIEDFIRRYEKENELEHDIKYPGNEIVF